MEKTLNELVREEAIKNKGCYNFHPQKETMRRHNDVCKGLVKLADEHSFPMGVLVYFAVGTNAHRPCVFHKGYFKLDYKKAENVIKMAEIVAKLLGDKYRTNDKIVHTLSRYYDINKGSGINLLKERLKLIDPIKLKSMKTAKEFANILFGDVAEYSKGGYIVVTKK
jgi:hypothetical protein